jgi:hypothetical protein
MPKLTRPESATRRHKPTSSGDGRLAARADRHDLYQRAVQCVEAEIDFVDQTFKSLRGRRAALLREDFCGTANTSCEWVRRRPTNRAIGLDLDEPTIRWGLEHNLSRLTPAQRARVDLRVADVLAPHPDLRGRLDAVLAMNFSFWTFHDRPTMLAYFRRVREDLAPDGVFFLDFYGGFDALKVLKERRDIPHARKGEPSVRGFDHPFTYIWDQAEFNPITGRMRCKIHFRLPDGSRLKDAFVYDWRLWTLPEIRDVLADAGFARSTVYWEGDDENGEGNGEFTATEQGEACASWVCFLSAEK